MFLYNLCCIQSENFFFCKKTRNDMSKMQKKIYTPQNEQSIIFSNISGHLGCKTEISAFSFLILRIIKRKMKEYSYVCTSWKRRSNISKDPFPYWTVLGFWNSYFEKSSSMNWIFCLYRIRFLQATKAVKIKNELDFFKLGISKFKYRSTWGFSLNLQPFLDPRCELWITPIQTYWPFKRS